MSEKQRNRFFREDCKDCSLGRYHFHSTTTPYGLIEIDGWHGARPGELHNDRAPFVVPESVAP